MIRSTIVRIRSRAAIHRVIALGAVLLPLVLAACSGGDSGGGGGGGAGY
jgi:hypothetical protein